MTRELDFERPVLEIERQIQELRRLAASNGANPSAADPAELPTVDDARAPSGDMAEDGPDNEQLIKQIAKLEERASKLKEQIFSRLSRWQTVQLARHPLRPFTQDHLAHAFSDFVELHGDRRFGEDPAIIGGFARLRGRPVVVVGHQKGRTTQENLLRNFGMPRPEGYRKAVRLFRLAEQFRLPVVTLVDTPGAYPGLGAEERGQSQAIAEALEVMAGLTVPVVSCVVGEGGSGGALAIGVANRVLMLTFSTYSVISPEGCASILFKDAAQAERAADALRLTARDLAELGVVDDVVEEPHGGAHRDPVQAAGYLADALDRHLSELAELSPESLRDDRYRRFRSLGQMEGDVKVLESLMAHAPATAPQGGEPRALPAPPSEPEPSREG
ncbi:MAG TPA: acetyl-CoA carboxylase carboxyltransferase subunit alpha [Myxococcales bacterium LLY-WYZ-16_1]|nr:acetyl-CoA carboxylase carboxyltransferase subunit alpha [Myxococcales bacterium LLY-WYZ-16_1]